MHDLARLKISYRIHIRDILAGRLSDCSGTVFHTINSGVYYVSAANLK